MSSEWLNPDYWMISNHLEHHKHDWLLKKKYPGALTARERGYVSCTDIEEELRRKEEEHERTETITDTVET